MYLSGNDHDNFKLQRFNTSQGLRGNKTDMEFGIHWCYVVRTYTIAKALKFSLSDAAGLTISYNVRGLCLKQMTILER